MISFKTSFSRKKVSALRKFFKEERDHYEYGSKDLAGFYLVEKGPDDCFESIFVCVGNHKSKTRLEEILKEVGGV